MFGPRMLLGAVIGGAAVYFLDPQNGAQRRERLMNWWDQNREPVMQTAHARAAEAQAMAAEVQAKAAEMGGRANEKVTELRSKVRP